MRLHAALCTFRLYLKDLYAAPVVFEVYTRVPLWLHEAPCISRLNLKGLHTAPVVFEVYKVAPCFTILNLKGLHTASVASEVYTGLHASPCGSCSICRYPFLPTVSKFLYLKNAYITDCTNFLTNLKLLSFSQFGLRLGKSTGDVILNNCVGFSDNLNNH